MNEELQSTNEELESVNNELRATSLQLQSSSRFFESVLDTLSVAVVALRDDLTVASWNRKAEDLWGLRADEVAGTHFLNLDIGLPVDELRAPIRQVLSTDDGPVRVELDAVNRRGRAIGVAVTAARLPTDDGLDGIILVMEGDSIGGAAPNA